MGKIGFIGYGAMGSIMLKALIDSGAIPENKVVLITRTPDKLKDFTKKYCGVEIAASLPELAKKSRRVFICTGTKEVKPVLTELTQYLPANAHVITITGLIEMQCVESIFPGKITRIMPNQIAEVGAGVTLICHNAKVLPGDRQFISLAFSKIGKIKEIDESQMGIATELTGCAPAFYAAILRHLFKVAAQHGNLTLDELKELIIPTFYGTAKLLMEREITCDDLITRVATKGGISEEGVKILDRTMPGVFAEVLTTTLEKRKKTMALMREQYGILTKS
jgi:pyrroline-5-carboxylate reductase